MKTELEKDASNESKGNWREHVFTRYLRARLEGNKTIALETLLRKCQTSSDPTVQAAYGAYGAIVAQIRLLTTGEA
jgi:hypothetical protein